MFQNNLKRNVEADKQYKLGHGTQFSANFSPVQFGTNADGIVEVLKLWELFWFWDDLNCCFSKCAQGSVK